MPDYIDLSKAQIDGSPDVRNWPITVNISTIDMDPVGGLTITFDRTIPESWKWYTGNGSDNYQYTVWLVVPINGVYHAQGFIQMWQGRKMGDGSLPPITNRFDPSGWIGGLGGQITAYKPKAGDLLGLLVTAGDARGRGTVSSVAERSNVVDFILPPGDKGHFAYYNIPPVQPPTDDPKPPVDPPAPQVVDLKPVLDAIKQLSDKIDAIKAPSYAGVAKNSWLNLGISIDPVKK